uniref:ZP domain-containing protein n=1 Tax=Mesocestoides corti TaxID=53468 RepID=A0A5K3F4V6_MESCO
MMQRCFSQRKPSSSLTTHFYVAGDVDPEYNVANTHPPASSNSSGRRTLLSFQMSADRLEPIAVSCFLQNSVLMSHRTFGPINMQQADVIVDTTGQLFIRNSRLSFSDCLSYPVEFENKDYNTTVQTFTAFIERQC